MDRGGMLYIFIIFQKLFLIFFFTFTNSEKGMNNMYIIQNQINLILKFRSEKKSFCLPVAVGTRRFGHLALLVATPS